MVFSTKKISILVNVDDFFYRLLENENTNKVVAVQKPTAECANAFE